MNWKTLIAIGSSTKGCADPFPAGFCIQEYQHAKSLVGMEWDKAIEKAKDSREHDILELTEEKFSAKSFFGNRILANIDGKAQTVAYHYDTSD
jgi:hypothetical protein